MKNLLIFTLSSVILASACGGTAQNGNSSAANANANANVAQKIPEPMIDEPSGAMDKVYEAALKQDCAGLDAMLTEEFKKSVIGGVQGFCESLTRKGQVEKAEVSGASASSETAALIVKLTMKEAPKTEDAPQNTNANAAPAKPAANKAANSNTQPAFGPKTENVDHFLRKIDGKWLVDVAPKPAKTATSPA